MTSEGFWRGTTMPGKLCSFAKQGIWVCGHCSPGPRSCEEWFQTAIFLANSLLRLLVIFLQATARPESPAAGANAGNGGNGAGDRGDAGNPVVDRGAPDRAFVKERFLAQRRIDQQIDFSALDVVRRCAAGPRSLCRRFPPEPRRCARTCAVPRVAITLEAHLHKICGNLRDELLVVLVDADERDPGLRQYRARADLRLDVGLSEGIVRRP